MTLGAIADDLTGAIDLGAAVSRAGRTVVVCTDVGCHPAFDDVDVSIVALRTRTAPVRRAVAESLLSARRLLKAGADRLFFKYCSTFDSTDKGNIGPVADALLDLTSTELALVCPAHPANGRTVVDGTLFVHGVPLAESSMADHPLTPMHESDVATLLSRQTAHAVEKIDLQVVEAGPSTVLRRIDELQAQGARYAVADAVTPRHLDSIAQAATRHRLVTGAAGLGGALASLLDTRPAATPEPDADRSGTTAILAGSCASATLAQVEEARSWYPSKYIDPVEIASGHDVVGDAIGWVSRHLALRAVVLYSSVDPTGLRTIQQELGRAEAAAIVETAFGQIATQVATLGVRNFIVAGGETAGSVIKALGIHRLRIREEIEPGVAWAVSQGETQIRCALKSGNFGSRRFFIDACES